MRRTTVNITEATERQVAALKSFGAFTEITRIAIDRLYRDEIISNKRPIVYTYVSDKWGNEQFETTLEDFKAMIEQVFGQAPELYEHTLDGYWVVTGDDSDEVILTTDPRRIGG